MKDKMAQIMTDTTSRINSFVEYALTLKGDEKGEAQVFCDRLFQAFNHAGYKEAGAELEYRVKAKGKSTKFADLLWRPRLLLEMSEAMIYGAMIHTMLRRLAKLQQNTS